MLPEKALTPGFKSDPIFELDVDKIEIERTPANFPVKMVQNKVQLE
jgi:hypothetical protein